MPDDRPDEQNPPPQGHGPFGGQYGGQYGAPGQPQQPRPWEQGGEWENQPGGQPYPRQHLLPQEIKPGRNRTPMFLAIGVVLVLVIAGGIAYLVLRDNGEGTREAYCAALRDLTKNGDLSSALEQADQSTVDDVRAVMDLAPDAVAGPWKKLDEAVKQLQSGTPDFQQAMALYGALREIASDARQHCDLQLDIPFS
jgi:hypothetical protein